MCCCIVRDREGERLSEQQPAAALVHHGDERPDIDLHEQRIGGSIPNQRYHVVPGEGRLSELREETGKEGTQGGLGLEETQGGETLLKWWTALLDAGTTGEGVSLPPVADHLEQQTKAILHGNGEVKVDGEWSFCMSHLTRTGSTALLLGFVFDFIGMQDMGGECHALRWTNMKRQSDLPPV